MKIFKIQLFTLFCLALLSSCGTVNHINGKLIVGSWKFEKAVDQTSAEDAEALLTQHKAEEQTKSVSSPDISNVPEIIPPVKEPPPDNSISPFSARFPDMITAIEFNADKTVNLTSRKTTSSGTWNMNNPGTKINITVSDTKKITRLELRKVDSTSLEISNPATTENLYLLYRKQ